MKNNINGLMYQYKQNIYLHKWLLPSGLPFLPLCHFNYLDVTVANIHIKRILQMGFNFHDRNSANTHKTHKLWHQSYQNNDTHDSLTLCTLAMHYIIHKNPGTFKQKLFPPHYYYLSLTLIYLHK